MQREKDQAISDLNHEHKKALRLETQLSSSRIKMKNNQLKEVSEEVVRLRASLSKTLDEMIAQRSTRTVDKQETGKLRV